MNAIILALSLIHSLPSSDKKTPAPQPVVLSLKPGNTTKELIIAFGEPIRIAEDVSSLTRKPYVQFVYVNNVCVGLSCSVFLEDGKIARFSGVKPELTN